MTEKKQESKEKSEKEQNSEAKKVEHIKRIASCDSYTYEEKLEKIAHHAQYLTDADNINSVRAVYGALVISSDASGQKKDKKTKITEVRYANDLDAVFYKASGLKRVASVIERSNIAPGGPYGMAMLKDETLNLDDLSEREARELGRVCKMTQHRYEKINELKSGSLVKKQADPKHENARYSNLTLYHELTKRQGEAIRKGFGFKKREDIRSKEQKTESSFDELVTRAMYEVSLGKKAVKKNKSSDYPLMTLPHDDSTAYDLVRQLKRPKVMAPLKVLKKTVDTEKSDVRQSPKEVTYARSEEFKKILEAAKIGPVSDVSELDTTDLFDVEDVTELDPYSLFEVQDAARFDGRVVVPIKNSTPPPIPYEKEVTKVGYAPLKDDRHLLSLISGQEIVEDLSEPGEFEVADLLVKPRSGAIYSEPENKTCIKGSFDVDWTLDNQIMKEPKKIKFRDSFLLSLRKLAPAKRLTENDIEEYVLDEGDLLNAAEPPAIPADAFDDSLGIIPLPRDPERNIATMIVNNPYNTKKSGLLGKIGSWIAQPFR